MKWTRQQLYNRISSSIQAGENVAISGNGNTLTISSTAAGGGGSGNAFGTASVSGQDNILANSADSALTFAAGSGISLATNASTDTLTITATGGGGGGNAFATASVSGEDNILANSSSGSITFAAGSGISLTTNASTDTLTITSTGGADAPGGLWTPPETANAADEEWVTSSLRPAWVGWRMFANATADFGYDMIPNYYDNFNSGSTIRVQINSDYTPSWIRLQPPDLSSEQSFMIVKPYTFPTNVLIYSRMRFTQDMTIANNDGQFGLIACALAGNGTDPDPNNFLQIYLNEPDDSEIRVDVFKREGGSWAQVGSSTTSVQSSGQALEYVVIHKVGSDYHLWTGTESNWIYIGNTTLSFTPAMIGYAATNKGSKNVMSSDFIRFIETPKWVL